MGIKKYINIGILILITLLISSSILFYSQWIKEREERVRQQQNVEWRIKSDSTRYAQQVFSEKEMRMYFQYENKELAEKLKADNIKFDRIERLIQSSFTYHDKVEKEFEMDDILKAIREGKNASKDFTDSTKCLTIKGNVNFHNDSLVVSINERHFHNQSSNVVYWERKKWNFLGIKSRLFGRKEFTAKSYDECGQSRTLDIRRKE